MSATLQIIDPEGQARVVPFAGMQMTIGRAPDNNVVLDHVAGGASGHHCVIQLDPSGSFVVQDRGSTNGTWIGERKVEGAVPLRSGARVTVGGYLLVLELAVAATRSPALGGAPRVALPMATVRGPLLAKSDQEHDYRRFRDQVARYASEWDRKKRPPRLLLHGRQLGRAELLLDTDHEQPFDDLEISFIRASRAGVERGRWVRGGMIGGGATLVLGLGLWAVLHGGSDEARADVAEADTKTEAKVEQVRKPDPLPTKPKASGVEQVAKKEWIEHKVIPAETLEDIALRYGVPLPSLVRWNSVGEDEPLEPGQVLKVKATNPPLAWQQITYSPERRESWSALAKRFDVSVDKLRAYNPTLGEKLSPSDEVSIWITPRPLKRREGVEIPHFEVRQDAISVGAPHDGSLENAIQFPENDQLYKRRAPNIMWCASYMAEHLQWAIAKFRYSYEFEGEMVVADMSQRNGGHFDPHKSHQAGRDVDIWLPTLKGVYKRDHLEKERKPFWWEADWFALYGFLQALQETGAVHAVFLDYNLQEYVYQAAVLMGATEADLEKMISWPHGQNSRTALLQHSDGHIRHIHVRFKCGPMDVGCSNAVKAHDAGD